MKLLAKTALLFLLFPCFAMGQKDIKTAIDASLRDNLLEKTDVSIVVFDLTEQKELYSHRAKKLCRPASTEKLITAITALACLGSDYTIDTRLCYTGELFSDSTLKGNIYVVGEMDPLFSGEDLNNLAAVMPLQRIKRIDGAMVADNSFTDSIYWGPGWSWDDNPYYYQPYLSSFMLNRGCIDITVTPTHTGEPPLVTTSPASHFYQIENKSLSYSPDMGKMTIMRRWLENTNTIDIMGNCNATIEEKMNMFPSQDFFFSTFMERIDSLGITYDSTLWAACHKDAELLYLHSRPIGEVVELALRESDNLCAEALLYHLGAQNGQRHLNHKQGLAVIDSFIQAHFTDEKGYRIADGSGLSPYNYIPASLLLKYLNWAYAQPQLYELLLQYLPHTGVEGTLENRPIPSSIHAKTGTVTGVCTLAGYVEAKNGHTLSFVLFNQSVLKPALAREWQNKICKILYNYQKP